MIVASQNGQRDVVKLLLEKGAQIDVAGTDSGLAAQNAIASYAIKFPLEKNIVNMRGWTALILASAHGHTDIVKLLLDKGALIDMTGTDGWTALIAASQTGHVDVASLLLDKGAIYIVDIRNIHGQTALTSASHGGHIDVIQLLLSKGTQVDAAEYDEWTALMIASENGNLDIVKLLLDIKRCSNQFCKH